MEKEIWKKIEDYPNYCVSNKGRIKSLNYNGTGKEQNLKPRANKYGYLNVHLCKEGKQKEFKLHRLVAEAFPEICGDLFKGCEVDHIDTNRENNNANNLRCVTPKENANNPLTKKHKSDVCKGRKLSEDTKRKIGEANKGKFNTKRSKPLLQINKFTNEVIREWESAMEVQRQFGFDNGSISECCNGKRKSAYGYKWQFKYDFFA